MSIETVVPEIQFKGTSTTTNSEFGKTKYCFGSTHTEAE